MLKEEQFRDEAGLMLLCAGVLQPMARGKGTKAHFLLSTMSWEWAQRCSWLLHKATRAVPSQQMWDRSTGSAQHHLPAPSTPPQPHLVFPAKEFPVEQGRCLRALCPCTEPGEMMILAAQVQPCGSGRAFPQVGVKNSFCPR